MDAQQHSLRLVEGYKVILASNSPRRKELLAGLGIDFSVRIIKDIDESYPALDADAYLNDSRVCSGYLFH